MNKDELLTFCKFIPAHKARLLRGPVGLGKTSFVRQVAAEANKDFILLNLAEYEPGDIAGMPYIANGTTVYAKPFWWPSQGSVILVDELDLCSREMKPIAMQLLLERVAGGRQLPDDCEIYATANGAGYMREQLDQGVVRRLAVIDYAPTVQEWLEYEVGRHGHNLVIDYIKQNPSKLDTPEELVGIPDRQIPCRSTWSDLSDFLNKIKNFDPLLMPVFCKPFIGEEATASLCEWVENNGKKVLTLDEVFNKEDSDASLVDLSRLIPSIAKAFPTRDDASAKRALKKIMASRELLAALISRLRPSEVERVSALGYRKDIARIMHDSASL